MNWFFVFKFVIFIEIKTYFQILNLFSFFHMKGIGICRQFTKNKLDSGLILTPVFIYFQLGEILMKDLSSSKFQVISRLKMEKSVH